MKKLTLNVVVTTLAMLASLSTYALPTCSIAPDSDFRQPNILFGTSITGPSMLLAKSDCASINIESGEYYDLFAADTRFEIRDHGEPVVKIDVPSEGDYVTNNTCSDPSFVSNEIRSQALRLRVFAHDGLVTIVHGNEHCDLKVCPAFGICE